MMGPVVLLTDLGSRDHSIGLMKGVLLSKNPAARIVDLCHEVPAEDVWTAAFYLLVCTVRYPPGSIFVTVVRSAESQRRRILWARTTRHQFLFSDTGCISWLAETQPLLEMRHVGKPELWLRGNGPSAAWRDIFAPVAGALSGGIDPSRLGRTVRVCHRMPFPAVSLREREIRGTILAIDGHGNAVTNIRSHNLRKGLQIKLNGRNLGRLDPQGSKATQAGVHARIGPAGFLTLSLQNGEFARRFRARSADLVELIFR